MPKTIKHNGITYRFNFAENQVEKVELSFTPIGIDDCPKEVLLKLLILNKEEKKEED